MNASHRRHDISDRTWELLEPHLPGREGVWGGIAKDNRLFINAVFWILRTGAPWRDLPPDLGDWSNTCTAVLCRWRDKGMWEKLLEILIDEPDYEWLMIDASHCKVHPHAAGAKGGNQDMSRTKGGSTPRYIWPWMRMVCRSEYVVTARYRCGLHTGWPPDRRDHGGSIACRQRLRYRCDRLEQAGAVSCKAWQPVIPPRKIGQGSARIR
jgi:transposase